MSEWKTQPLSDLADIVTGATPAAAQTDSWGNEVDFITPSDQKDNQREAQAARRLSSVGARRLTKRIVPARSTNLTCIGSTIGKVSMTQSAAVTNQQINSIIARRPVSDPDFIYYLIKNWSGSLKDHASGSATPIINKSVLSKFEFLVPPVYEQRAIAEVLGALDDKIAANTKLASSAEELISVHFQRAIESEGTTSRSLFEVIDVDFGEPFKGSDFSDPGTGRPLIRIRDLKTFTSQVWTTENRSREILIQPGEVVVGMDAEFRPTTWLGEPGLLNQRVCRARGKSAGPAFVRETLRAPLRRIESSKSATTVIHLNKKDLDEAKVLVPGSESLVAFETAVEALYSLQVSIALENRLLATTREALLPQLVTGKLKVKDAEKVLEDAGV
ncbi:type I restriction enzyme, S subunit [Arthrobacter sp. yr096]|uniref:restriction endonuclease subunit S n=1 Tax=Arthrobacter sp. yr096 TaxID=1761750 RepID=UPI0008CDE1E3|nr:restriction endonuclease subunit S [Arthrobacter sp. yr096]SEJ49739.1 type I restriction enzyme, S subunit [Arthrobacter sp. yr096]